MIKRFLPVCYFLKSILSLSDTVYKRSLPQVSRGKLTHQRLQDHFQEHAKNRFPPFAGHLSPGQGILSAVPDWEYEHQ